jgi:septum formation protein
MKYVYPIGKDNPLVLASLSERRKDILTRIGVPFEAVGSKVRETLDGKFSPAEMAFRMAIRKAGSVHHLCPNRWILGADTIVVCNRRIFGKPRDAGECRDMLLYLSGRNHRVITGFCIVDPGGTPIHTKAVTTRVKVKELGKREIEAYIKTGEPFGKAGSYAIQGIGSFMIEYIRGSYTNVVGLPVHEVVNALIEHSALEVFPLIDLDE